MLQKPRDKTKWVDGITGRPYKKIPKPIPLTEPGYEWYKANRQKVLEFIERSAGLIRYEEFILERGGINHPITSLDLPDLTD